MPLSGPGILLYEKKDKIVTITLNRPEKSNALNPEMFERLAQAWEKFEADDDAWVAILTGAGKVFSAGGDINEMEKLLRNLPRFFFMQMMEKFKYIILILMTMKEYKNRTDKPRVDFRNVEKPVPLGLNLRLQPQLSITDVWRSKDERKRMVDDL